MRVPGIPLGDEGLHEIGFVGGSVVFFLLVVGEVEESRRPAGGEEKFPRTAADCAKTTHTEEQRIVRGGGLGCSEVWGEVDAVKVGGRRGSGERSYGGEDVEGDDGMVEFEAGREDAGKGGEERHADAAFVERPLVVTERETLAAVLGVTAVVADEEDDGLAVETGGVEFVEDAADGFVEGGDGRDGIGAGGVTRKL